MMHFQPGSQVYMLVEFLSVAGEFPTCSMPLIGNERVLKTLINNLTKPQQLRGSQTETTCRLLTVTGKGANRRIRLYKGALPILKWIGAEDYYLGAFWNHKFPGDQTHINRNFRVAETIAICLSAGVEYRPYKLPELCNSKFSIVIPSEPVFYPSKTLKQYGDSEIKKTAFTRITGMLFTHGQAYAVYNSRNALMKWNGLSEFKMLNNMIEICRLNAGINNLDSAILFCQSDSVALATLKETEKNHRLEFRFDSIYQHIHYFPLNDIGIRQFRLLTVPNWKEELLGMLFEEHQRSYNRGNFEYDAFIDGVYIFSFLDSDIARLIRFKNAAKTMPKCEVLCFPNQQDLVKEFIGHSVRLKLIELETVEDAFGIKEQK